MRINSLYRQFFKQTIDFCLSVCLILLVLPVFLLIAILLKLHRQPVFFRQLRPGHYGKPFRVYKFTTMIAGRPHFVFPFGRFLRSTSLDELPQLINVLRGEMSLIGPRPLLMEYLPEYSVRQGRRHLVKPGITGWAQVNGRNRLSLEEKIELDVFYVDKLSFWLDLKIFYMTLRQLYKWEESDYHRLNEIEKVG